MPLAYIKTPEQSCVCRKSAPEQCKDNIFFLEIQIVGFRVNISGNCLRRDGILLRRPYLFVPFTFTIISFPIHPQPLALWLPPWLIPWLTLVGLIWGALFLLGHLSKGFPAKFVFGFQYFQYFFGREYFPPFSQGGVLQLGFL